MSGLLNSPIYENLLSCIRKKFHSFLMMEVKPFGYQAFLKVSSNCTSEKKPNTGKESKGENLSV